MQALVERFRFALHISDDSSGRDNVIDTKDMVACPTCDTLHRLSDVPQGTKARCRRCHAVLMTPRAGAMTQIIMLSATALVLMVAAVAFPFLDLSAAGLAQHSSVIDTITAFSDGLLLPLSFAVAALIVVLPTVRLCAVIYAIAPMAIGYRPARGAEAAFRLAQNLRPWAMAEIFVVGVVVALVKIAGMASVALGPAFWAFIALVLVTTLKDTFMCKLTVWKTLEERRNS
ncbi:MAG: paraquat-inducible membrane protein A [Pseudooceanicola sp.]|nr:paraquat-inducible membrane protein A [Pseudooceanicola sp.]